MNLLVAPPPYRNALLHAASKQLIIELGLAGARKIAFCVGCNLIKLRSFLTSSSCFALAVHRTPASFDLLRIRSEGLPSELDSAPRYCLSCRPRRAYSMLHLQPLWLAARKPKRTLNPLLPRTHTPRSDVCLAMIKSSPTYERRPTAISLTRR